MLDGLSTNCVTVVIWQKGTSKRPKDSNQLAKQIGDIATGETKDNEVKEEGKTPQPLHWVKTLQQ